MQARASLASIPEHDGPTPAGSKSRREGRRSASGHSRATHTAIRADLQRRRRLSDARSQLLQRRGGPAAAPDLALAGGVSAEIRTVGAWGRVLLGPVERPLRHVPREIRLSPEAVAF